MTTSDGLTLLGQATAEEIEHLRQFQAARNAASAEAARLGGRARELEQRGSTMGQIAQRLAAERRAAIVASALGEGDAPPPAAPPEEGPSPDELRDAARVLRERAAEKEKEAAQAHGALRSATIDLIRECAQRLGAIYAETADRLSAVHTGIAAAQLLLAPFTGPTEPPLVDPEWERLLVPNSSGLLALRGTGVVRGAMHLRMPVVGGDGGGMRRQVVEGHDAIRSELRALLGEWPLDGR
ncbi:hypothetical protein [Anaeromyxobacter dehalogenans]|uniref:Uncharacterized protein n=1 Tax=Anaeromyxobacter dehalogenans (strain 2CP-C) TaxID=290397 RepID=Q2IJ22_ANADE|nr:hypothetical protein [Anaeromyxobacter dehalogenans]ABC81650.1 hypothetical protein Adeh_1879 [Anaeromyxobacter dehalogenans 2CP-C]